MVRNSLAKLINRLSDESKKGNLRGPDGSAQVDPDHLPPRSEEKSHAFPTDAKVCIVGAGIAGLYSAMILDHLSIPYDILEAAPRPGGRILTHYFSTKKHDYYDIGAMRFPNVPPMERTFDLFKRTGVPLIDYKISGENTPRRYNGITVFPPKEGAPVEEDPFHVGESKGGAVPDEALKNLDDVMKKAFAPLKDALKRGDAESFKMFEELDDYTVRDYLTKKMRVVLQPAYRPVADRCLGILTTKPFSGWRRLTGKLLCDTSSLTNLPSATGQFESAFTEAVMDSIAFDYGEEEENWKSVEGGTNMVTEAVIDMIKTKPTYNKRVTRMALNREAEGENKMEVVTNYDEPVRRYASVINTTTLACLQRVDTTNLELSPTVKIATRTLHYDSATKVAIKFNKAWWITKCGIKSGGVAYTDLPIRACVYPSYNIHDDPEKPAILLCTYSWAQDATRIGSLVGGDSPRGEEELKGLMLYNLARLHSTDENFDEMYDLIKTSYITHHGFDWAMDDYSSGAYAFFGPGQFRSFYPHLIRPHADARFHIVGEAASANHAWIVGSIESAYRGVWLLLERFKCYDAQAKMAEEFGHVPELETGKDGVAHLLVALGMLKPAELARGEKEVVNGTPFRF
ncbi:MAG: hypothetical protein LQ344_007249 [Seirophora lacunosa]|nr:MAG: hypothetical protein LQ344_007249 [Seirophora lacunosa]